MFIPSQLLSPRCTPTRLRVIFGCRLFFISSETESKTAASIISCSGCARVLTRCSFLRYFANRFRSSAWEARSVFCSQNQNQSHRQVTNDLRPLCLVLKRPPSTQDIPPHNRRHSVDQAVSKLSLVKSALKSLVRRIPTCCHSLVRPEEPRMMSTGSLIKPKRFSSAQKSGVDRVPGAADLLSRN